MLKLNRQRGTTLILITHDHELAALADRRIALRDGRVVSDSNGSAGERSETGEAGKTGEGAANGDDEGAGGAVGAEVSEAAAERQGRR
jgi:energy-coupling factor transporter ATP-binding protein EcfA2